MAQESTGKTNWKGPVVGGIAAVAHFFLWLAIAAGLKRWTGSDQWQSGLGGFNLVASPLIGMLFGSATSESAKPVKFLLPPSLAGLYCLLGAMFGRMVPDGTLFWLILAIVGVPVTALLWLWCRHLPGITKADLAEIAATMPAHAVDNPFKNNKLGCIVLLVMLAIGLGSVAAGAALYAFGSIQSRALADRLIMGGICLGVSAMVAAAFFSMLRTKKVPAPTWSSWDEPWWNRRRQLDRAEAPGRYRFYLILFLLLAVAMVVMSVAAFLGAFEDLSAR